MCEVSVARGERALPGQPGLREGRQHRQNLAARPGPPRHLLGACGHYSIQARVPRLTSPASTNDHVVDWLVTPPPPRSRRQNHKLTADGRGRNSDLASSVSEPSRRGPVPPRRTDESLAPRRVRTWRRWKCPSRLLRRSARGSVPLLPKRKTKPGLSNSCRRHAATVGTALRGKNMRARSMRGTLLDRAPGFGLVPAVRESASQRSLGAGPQRHADQNTRIAGRRPAACVPARSNP